MHKFLKYFLSILATLIILMGALMAGFMYKVKNGFPVAYETEKPTIHFPQNQPAILLFSKTTGFRHSESIEASKPIFADLSKKNNYFLYETEAGGVFNTEQLAKFSAVIFNNSTGEVINAEQKKALENYVGNGGNLIGIHGAGDDSHHWDWYEKNLLGAKFSHHPLKPQFQSAQLTLEPLADSTLWHQLPQKWTHTDEWYIFFDNPRQKNFNILYTIDGEKVVPNGNMLWIKDKNFGMGKDHPVAWCKNIGEGSTFYTAIGHAKEAWQNPTFVQLISNALASAVKRKKI
jgi:uncharacterized protein